MNVRLLFVAHAQAPELIQPGEGSLHHPSPSAQSAAMFRVALRPPVSFPGLLRLRRPPLGFRNGPALLYVQISRMTIIKTPTSYFACASFVTTAATLSSIWFQPSI
jgi:hypothetical protein